MFLNKKKTQKIIAKQKIIRFYIYKNVKSFLFSTIYFIIYFTYI